LDDKTGDLNEDTKIPDFNNNYRRNLKENKSSNINRILKQSSVSPNTFIPLSTTHKIEKITNYNYSNSNLSSNFSKRDISREKNKPDISSMRPSNFIPETTKSPIKIFSPTNKNLVLTTKNRYSNLGNKFDSFFMKKDLNLSKKSASPRRNLLEETKNHNLDIRSVDKVKQIFNYKNNKPNSLKVITKATSPHNETPRNLNDTTTILNLTKNRSKEQINNEVSYNKEKSSGLKEKIIRFCKSKNFEINEVNKVIKKVESNHSYEVRGNNHKLKIEFNNKNPSLRPFKVTHLRGKEESTKEFLVNLINNIDKEI
jgi:hypothetical protein